MTTIPQNIIPRFLFENIEEAIAYAKGGAGGWIAECEDGSIHWFNASLFKMTSVIEIIIKEQRGTANVGPWQLFDPTHECHTIIRHKRGK